MINLNQRQKKIIAILLRQSGLQSSVILKELTKLGEEISLVTVKRDLSEMVRVGALIEVGSGRYVNYILSTKGRIFFDVDAHEYCSIDPDKRYGLRQYNFDVISSVGDDVFSSEELERIELMTAGYKSKSGALSATIQKKELERFVIELSWKSSKIEGNTYTLLDTEKLIMERKKAEGKTEQEARMILNHKDAFDFIYKKPENFKTITRKNLDELHTILIKDLGIDAGFRKDAVGITGSIYRPLDNIHQINDAVEVLASAISQIKSPYAKALLALIGISYIQPFADGNKRTGRLMADALLLAYGLPPLSYRSTDENDYREATLSFYELNSIIPIKKIFIGQYEFTVQNYKII